MVSFRVIPVFLVAVQLTTLAAQAASVTNRDDRDHKVTIIEGQSQKDHILKPNTALEGICEKGCLIRLDDNQVDPFELEGSEVTSIEDGQLYDDEPGASVDPGSGETGPPSQPGPRP